MNSAPEIIYGVGAFLLLAALVYGFWRDEVRARRKLKQQERAEPAARDQAGA